MWPIPHPTRKTVPAAPLASPSAQKPPGCRPSQAHPGPESQEWKPPCPEVGGLKRQRGRRLGEEPPSQPSVSLPSREEEGGGGRQSVDVATYEWNL